MSCVAIVFVYHCEDELVDSRTLTFIS